MIAAIVLGLCVALVLYPFAFYPLLLRLVPEKPVARAEPGAALPAATLVFCAFNEAAALPGKIANLRSLKVRHPDLEILAFNDGSTDATPALLAAAADILTVIDGPGRSGKARGMKTLAARARGDILIFTDANVRLEEALKDRESRTGNVMGADGSIFSIRRALYPDFPDHVLDDLVVSMSVVFAGKRLIKARDVVAWENMVAERRDEMKRKVRIAARSWHTHRYLRPQLCRMRPLDRFKYGSRKLVRWSGGLWIGIGAVAAFMLAWSIAPKVAAVLALVCGNVIIIGIVSHRGPLAALMDILLAYFATLRGIALAMRGRDFTIWAPAKSRG